MYKSTVPIIIDTHFDKETLLRELRRCKADRIAFALNRELEHTFTSPANMKRLKEMLGYFKEQGFETAVWIGETLGHDQVTQYPEGYEEPYRHMKLPVKGTVASFCPTDEKFTADLCKWVASVAALKPDLILLDDDYRLNGGCICSTHVDWMNREIGETLTAEKWVQKAFIGPENKYRNAWIKVQGETLYRLARALRSAVDEVNPDQRMGICASYYLWDADGVDAKKLTEILAGKNKPFLRTFGAPYHSYTNGKDTLGTSLELERWETSICKDWGFEQIAEGDTYPRPRFHCPASYLECFDQVLRADGGPNGILKYSMDYCSNADYEQGYTDAWEENLPLYEAIEHLFRGKKAVGVMPYLVPHLLQKANLKNAAAKPNFRILKHSGGDYNASFALAVHNNLPTTYEETGAKIVFGENARYLPKELCNGCILDLPAAEILRQRGIDVGVAEKTEGDQLSTTYLGGAAQYFVKEQEYVRISGSHLPSPVVLSEGTEILTEFVSGEVRIPGWVRYENQEGQRFLVFPFDTKELFHRKTSEAGYLMCYALRRMLTEQIEWLTGSPLDAYAQGNHPWLYTMVKKGEDSLAIGLWNLFDDKIQDLTVKINGDYKNLRFVNCTGEKTATGVRITSPLYPYEFAGIELSQ